jgi:glycosyltransferase involved in cell wall biosynthesis
MFETSKIAVIVPAHNEERLIGKVLESLPPFVTEVCVIDDCSSDRTAEMVGGRMSLDPRITLIRHDVNRGVGGALATGYKWARERGVDVAVVMAGDAQMSPADLPALLRPVLEEGVDYAKGNRLLHPLSGEIPRVRFFGNSVLSLLTKIASGYWHVADSQCGYTAIGARALQHIDWDRMYQRYGQPNDLLVTLNVHSMRVRDVEVAPVYNIGEQSGFRAHRVIWPISRLLIRKFFWRLKEKYIIRDFHPLVFFYGGAFLFSAVSMGFLVRLVMLWIRTGTAPTLTLMALLFSAGYALQSLFFAMWMDMEANKHLR